MPPLEAPHGPAKKKVRRATGSRPETAGNPNVARTRVVRPKSAPAPKPTRTQIRSSRAQEQGYRSQGKAVRKVAQRQQTTARAKAQERGYRSQGRSVERQANDQRDAERASAWGGNQKLSDKRVKQLIARGMLERHGTGLFSHELRLGSAHPGYQREQATIGNLSALAARGHTQAGVASSGLELLKQTTRPLHASAGTANALVKGKNVGEALKEGGSAFLHNKGVTYSDVLKSAGVKNKLVRAIGGTALDVVLSPGAGAKLTRLSPAEALERKAGAAEVKGATEKAAKLRAKAATASKSRGIQAGYSAKIPFGPRIEAMTSGRTTAKVGEKLKPAAEKAHETKLVQTAGRSLSPTFREKGVTREEHEKDLASRRQAAQRKRAADRKGERRGTAHARASKNVDREQMVASVEQAAKKPLKKTRRAIRVTPEAKRVREAQRRVTAARIKAARAEGGAITRKARPGRWRKALQRLGSTQAAYHAARSEYDSASRDFSEVSRLWRESIAKGRKDSDLARQLDSSHTRLTQAQETLDAALDAYNHAANEAVTSRLTAEARMTAKAQRELEAARVELGHAREASKGKPASRQVLVDVATKRPYAEVMHGAERHNVSELTGQARKVAETTQRELGQMAQREKAAGVLEQGRENYYPHKLRERTQADSATQAAKRLVRRKSNRTGRDAKLKAAQHRKDERPISEIEFERQQRGKEPLFSTDHGTVMAQRTAESERALADAQRLKDLKTQIGRPLTQSSWAKRRETDGVYEITPTSIKPIEKRNGDVDTEAVQQALQAGKAGDLVLLPRAIGNREVGALRQPESDFSQAIAPLQKSIGWWKTVVTVLNVPFYQLRNFYDDAFRMWAGDGTAHDLATAVVGMKKLIGKEHSEARKLDPEAASGYVKIGKQRIPWDQFIKQAEQDGAVRTGFFGGELRDLEQTVAPRTGANRFRPIRAIHAFGQNSEDVTRLASYIGARRRGLTGAQAGAHVRLYHFDYTELTDTEKALRLVIPFYTYSRRNTELQLRLLVSRPGKQAAVQAFREEAFKYAGLNPNADEKLTSADQKAFPFPVLVGGNLLLAYPPLGITDLNRIPFATTWDQVKALPRQQYDLTMQMLSPGIKIPVEVLQNYSFFFRDAIYRDADHPDAERWAPAPTALAKIPGLRDALGITRIQDPSSGKMIWAWPMKVDYILRSLGPQFGLAASVNTPVKNSRGQTATQRLIGQATGIRWVNYETEKLKGAIDRMYTKRGQIDAGLADLEDKGRKNSPAYKKLQTQRDVVSSTIYALTAQKSGQTKLAKAYRKQGRLVRKMGQTRKGDIYYRGPSGDSGYETAQYQRLADEKALVDKRIAKLRGTPKKRVVRLSRRPPTLRQKLEAQRQNLRSGNLREQLERDVARERARGRILGGG